MSKFYFCIYIFIYVLTIGKLDSDMVYTCNILKYNVYNETGDMTSMFLV